MKTVKAAAVQLSSVVRRETSIVEPGVPAPWSGAH